MTGKQEALAEQEIKLFLPDNLDIIIVEDDRGHYTLIKKCLRQAGVSNEIIWLEDGRTALDFFFDETFNPKRRKYIVLLDIRLPKLDGTVVLERIKTDERLNSIPVIMLTTSEDQSVAARCYELGCDAHVIKPPGNILLSAIERVGERM